jgi:hypothetical protein
MAPSQLSLPLAVALGFSAIAHALPAPEPNPVAEAHPEITPFRIPQIPTRTFLYQRRDILSDIEGGVKSILSGLGSDIPSYVASGMTSAGI